MKKVMEIAKVRSQRPLADGIYDLVLYAPKIAAQAGAGQFVSVYTGDAARLLPRPVSLCGIAREPGELRLVYRVTGEQTGTAEFARLAPGDEVRILGPLGNGFTVLPGRRALLAGGGIGVPPMLQLAKEIRKGTARGLCAADGGGATPVSMELAKEIREGTARGLCAAGGTGVSPVSMQLVMGYRDASTFLLEEFEEQAECFAATEDGSVGTKGNVLDAIRENHLEADVIYACGPAPMLRALSAYAKERGMDCYVSLEERMACGIGACLACVCESNERDAHTNVNNKRICKEGPVFDAREVKL